MATYNRFKKIINDNIETGAIVREDLSNGFGKQSVFIVANECALFKDACTSFCNGVAGMDCGQALGRCCLWTVPNYVKKVTFELWSGGGGGGGLYCLCCNNHTIHGGGGGYAVKTINTSQGCQYTICAGGTAPCLRNICSAGSMGCASFVVGFNLANFCVNGGCGGCAYVGQNSMDPCWGETCISTCAPNACGFYGADFGIMGTSGSKIGHSPTESGITCLRNMGTITGAAPFTGKSGTMGTALYWCHCGCYVVWPGGGGFTAATTYCQDPGQQQISGGMGGSGMVKITYA